MPEAPPQNWTTRTLLAWMTEAFAKATLDSPRLMAEMLLSHALGVGRLDLYTGADRPASEEERTRLRALVARALRHEPVQYLTGEAWFFSLAFKADRRALIPRPSTETIVETVLQDARRRFPLTTDAPNPTDVGAPAIRIADVCTGSGVIAISLLKNLPSARCVATDISPDALALASENAARHGVEGRLDLRQGDLLEPLRQWAQEARGNTGGGAGDDRASSQREFTGFDYIAANPPYIPDEEWPAVAPNVKGHEPEIALRGGPEGRRLVAPLLEHAPALLNPGGMLLVEIAMSSADAALALARANPLLRDVKVLEDSDGLPRVVVGARAERRA